MKVKYIANAVKWFDKVNGNTYHSVNITRCEDGKTIYCPFQYGYGEQYRYTTLEAMFKAGWLPEKYNKDTYTMFEEENGYPIYWDCTDGLKRDCVANGIA